MVDQQTIAISVEDVQNLRRMHRQQYQRLLDAKTMNDGPAAGRALNDLVVCHMACTDMLDVVEYMLTHWTPPATSEGSSDDRE
jgi:hypothetical protein